MPILPTGAQYPIAFGNYRAIVTQVGATLRSLTFDGTELLWTFAEDAAPSGSAGRQLLPWPNRIRDGRYRFDERDFQLPITEVPRNNAIHGLGAGVAWQLVKQSDCEVVQSTTIYPQAGWDGVLEVSITHRLSEDGLQVSVEASNVGHTRLPYGYGAHPYFKADLANTELSFTFTKELAVEEERLLPIEVVSLTPEHDFRTARPIGETFLDTALTGLAGQWNVRLVTNAHTIEVWADQTMGWGQIFTRPARDAIAVEPMTCGPDAFNPGPTHDDLIVLSPGESTRCVWGIRAS